MRKSDKHQEIGTVNILSRDTDYFNNVLANDVQSGIRELATSRRELFGFDGLWIYKKVMMVLEVYQYFSQLKLVVPLYLNVNMLFNFFYILWYILFG